MSSNLAVRAVFTRPGQLFLDAISTTSAIPGARLVLQGIAFDPVATLAVRFSNGSGFSVDSPVVASSATELTVIVPPFIDPTTRELSSGTVSVAVGETTDAGTRVSNAIEGFRIDALPTSELRAGSVTLAFLESLVEMARQNLAAVEATALDSVDFKIALASQITQLEWLTGEINRVVQDPNQAFELGSLNQQVIEVATGDLEHVDRMILGMLTEMASGETALAALMSDEYATRDRVVRAARSSSACQAAGAGQVLDAVGQGDHDAVQQSFTVLNDAAFGCGVIESVTPVIQVVGGLAGVGLGAAALLGVSSSALTVPVALVGIITFQTGAALWGVGHEFRHSIAGTVTINLAGSGTAADPYTGTMEASGTDTVSTVSSPPGLDCSADNVFFGSVAPTPITANGNTIEATLAGDGFTVRFRGQVQSDRITGTTTVTIPDVGLVIDIATTLTQTATLAMLMSRSQRSPTPAIPSWAAVDAVLASWDSRWSGH